MSHTIVPYLVAKGAKDAIQFYAKAFGAVEDFRMTDPGDGRIGHAELVIGESRIMLSDEYPDFGAVSPDTLGGTAVTFHLATTSVDGDVAQAVAAGATLLRAPRINPLANARRRCWTRSVTGGCCRKPSRRFRPKRCRSAGKRKPLHDPACSTRARGCKAAGAWHDAPHGLTGG
ncbi:VOC family protein [Sulfitobacter porphyrae]|uniref:VOC family protein n=1 Tax=Sulfitobacter porphyrae TaxID=1246864 RepID=A0ABW2B2U6_9RHOB